jgi:hypothetical protein
LANSRDACRQDRGDLGYRATGIAALCEGAEVWLSGRRGEVLDAVGLIFGNCELNVDDSSVRRE